MSDPVIDIDGDVDNVIDITDDVDAPAEVAQPDSATAMSGPKHPMQTGGVDMTAPGAYPRVFKGLKPGQPGWENPFDFTTNKGQQSILQKMTSGVGPKVLDTIEDAKHGNFDFLKPDMGTLGPPKKPGSTFNQDMYRDAAEEGDRLLPNTTTINPGSVINPLNLVSGGAGFLENAAANMLPDVVEKGMQGKSITPGQALSAVGGAGLGHAASGLMTGGLTRFQNAVAETLGPRALKWLKDIARSGAMHSTNLTTDAANTIVKPGSSKMGLENAEDDLVYSYIRELNPSVLDSSGDIARKLAQNKADASTKIGEVMDPVREIPVDSKQATIDTSNIIEGNLVDHPGAQKFLGAASDENLLPKQLAQQNDIVKFGDKDWWAGKALSEGSVGGQIRPEAPSTNTKFDPNQHGYTTTTTPGKTLEQLPEMELPRGEMMGARNPDVTTSRAQQVKGLQGVRAKAGVKVKPEATTVPLGTFDEMSKSIESQMYNPAASAKLGIENPIEAGTAANKELEGYVSDYMTPGQQSQFKEGNAEYGRRANLQNAMMPGLTKAASENNFAAGTGLAGTALGAVARKAKTIGFQGAKSVAEYAVNRLAQSDVPLSVREIDLSPFQRDAIAAKFKTLSQMDAKDAATFAYAQSMMDPMFREVMKQLGGEMSGQNRVSNDQSK